MGITINPVLVTNAAGSFIQQTRGGVQGTLDDDPVKRFAIVSGIVAGSVTGPIWGGMGITETNSSGITAVGPGAGAGSAFELGPSITLATAETNLTGFTVNNQAHAMVTTPQSPVPQAASYMAVNFVRLGSGARLWVQCSAAVAGAFEGVAVNTPAYWDYTNQVLLSAAGGTAIAVKVIKVDVGNSKVVNAAAAASGVLTWNNSGSAALIEI